MNIIITIIVILALWFLIKSVTIVRIILTVALGIVYIPINKLNMIVQKWYFKMREKDEVIKYAFAPFYWILVGITFVISIPYEFVIAQDIH